MIDISPLALGAGAALVVLTGSLIGSTFIFLGRRPQEEPPSPGYRKPADWPVRSGGVAQHPSAVVPTPQPRTSLLAMLFVGVVFYAITAVGLTVYKSQWDPEVTLRHLAATLHCDLARKVELAPARIGEPGYHARNDGNGNGVACESYGAAMAGTTVPEISVVSEPLPEQSLETQVVTLPVPQ